MATIQRLTKQDIDDFVEGYLRKPFLSEKDDPISDMANFVGLAYDMPGVRAIHPTFAAGTFAQDDMKCRRFVMAAADYLYAINPSLEKGDWALLMAAVIAARYGGTYVRIRKRPQQAALLDARFMMPKELMKKYGKSRSWAYGLRAKALKQRREETQNKR